MKKSFDKFLNDLKKESQSESFRKKIKNTIFKNRDFVYATSLKGKEFTDKVFKDGTRITGKLINNQFESIEE